MIQLLIVEDEERPANLLKGFFEVQGFAVQVALSGEQALQALEQCQPHVLLLDLNLEGSRVSGLEVLAATKQRSPKTAVFIASGYTEKAYKDEASRLGADRYFEKPLPLAELLEAIQAAANRP